MRIYSRFGTEPKIRTSSANTTTTPLSSGATFTGAGEHASDDGVVCSCITDNSGTLYFDFSPDGTNWAPFPVNGFNVAAGIHEYHTGRVNGRYFRVRLVNDTGAQTYLRLYCYFGPHTQPNSPINQTLGADADATVVRSVSSDLDLALGRFGGMSEDTQTGYVLGIDAPDGTVHVWAFANDGLSTRSYTKTFPTSAATLYAASDSAADTSKVFTAWVIGSDGLESQIQWTTDASDGRTAVSLGVSGLDVNRVRLTGSNQTHAGNVYVQQGSAFTSGVPNTPSAVLAFVPAGYGKTQQCMRRVPSDKLYRVKGAIVTVARASGALGSAELHLSVKLAGESWVVEREWHLQTGDFIKRVAGLVLPGGSIIVVSLVDVSDTDTNVTAELVYDEVDV